MLNIGSHLSSAKGFLHLGKDALKIDANTFQFFLRNPRGTRAKAMNQEDVNGLRNFLAEHHFAPIVAHAPYTLNPCSSNAHVRDLAQEMFHDDLLLMKQLPGNYYNFHPGSHLGQDMDTAVSFISSMLNRELQPGQPTMVLLETMSGKGTEVGRTFQELRAIIDQVDLQEQIGVCFDACHLSDSGYDIVHNLDGVLDEFDRIIGLGYLHAFHINDSQNPPGSRKDRHALIGDGYIGLDSIVEILNHPLLRHLTFILETPTDLDGHADEIKLLRSLYRD